MNVAMRPSRIVSLVGVALGFILMIIVLGPGSIPVIFSRECFRAWVRYGYCFLGLRSKRDLTSVLVYVQGIIIALNVTDNHS